VQKHVGFFKTFVPFVISFLFLSVSVTDSKNSARNE